MKNLLLATIALLLVGCEERRCRVKCWGSTVLCNVSYGDKDQQTQELESMTSGDANNFCMSYMGVSEHAQKETK